MNKSSPILSKAVVVAAIGYFVDMFDTFLLPVLRVPSLRDLGVPTSESFAAYIHIMNAQLGGMVVGAVFLWGPFADRRGRRQILIGSIVVYSLANLLTACAQDAWQYGVIRFLAGIGLGGELGAGIALVSENMDREKRGWGTMAIGSFGILGIVAAGLLAKSPLPWRVDYAIGGMLGLGILALRLRVPESMLFERNVDRRKTAGYWSILRYLFSWPQVGKLAACILVGAPTYFISGLLVPGAPEFGKVWGMAEVPQVSTALICTYLSNAVGDVLCGLVSQTLRSRKIALLLFHLILAAAIICFLFYPPSTPAGFYWRCGMVGLGIGYWVNLVTNASEQWGTNVRGAVTIIVPNIVRLFLLPISFFFGLLKPSLGMVHAGAVVGLSCSAVAIAAVLILKDHFRTDLDYNESALFP